MYYLAEAFPIVKRIKLPLSRDQLILLMAAVNELFLGLDIWLAHSISGTIVPREWIPIIFGPAAGVLLLVSGLIALRNRPVATVLANIVLVGSIIVGLLGAYFHVVRGIRPDAPVGARLTIDLIVWAPPVIGPLMFSLIGLMGISAAWVEDPPDSGQLKLFGERKIKLPYSKTRALLFMVSLGTLATLLSSVLDHARTDFQNPWLWVPTSVGVLGTVVAAMLAAFNQPTRRDIRTYIGAMLLLVVVGLVGMWLHIGENLTTEGLVVQERFIRGAPFLAPTLFSNLGMLGLLAILDPRSEELQAQAEQAV
ncbi:MAG: hypothetical protein JXB38_09345 [Anaerolineales bacterium]|nr:hypothetical protein [Anaerolineales bacterium]